jgi:transposase-like protein
VGILPDSLRNWVQQSRIDAGAVPGLATDERARLAELEREVRELRRAARQLAETHFDARRTAERILNLTLA